MNILAKLLMATIVMPLMLLAGVLLCAACIVGMAGIGFWAVLED